ncbi:MAG TPA: nucleotidyltransferase family protein, partial [Caulobacteraceae bacterium]|nr:nucleotidyltransferase family protein [Caulobacteraceae bacterium]
MRTPKTALVLAAGLGTRMRPLTNDRPKALVEVGGRALIDHVLDRLADAGVETAVVNVHAFADRLEGHLAARRAPRIVISDERACLLETGGGLKKARALVGEEPILVANIDSVWLEDGVSAIEALTAAWDPARMDACLLLARLDRSIGFDGSGDFFLEGDGRLTFRGESPSAPFAYMGLHITKPQIVDGEGEGAFSLAPLWRQMAEEGRLHGAVMDGFWMHVG